MGPKKRKKSKKQLLEEQEEALRLAKQEAEELSRMRLARLIEIKNLQEDAKLREKRSINEHSIRLYILEKNVRLFESVKKKFLDDRINMRQEDEWRQYLCCDRLPLPSDPSSMNTHLYYWSSLKEAEFMDNILEWIEKYIALLSDLERLIEEPLDATPTKVENWKEVRESYRSEIFKKFDQGTFHILRKIETKMNRIDYWTVDYKRITKNVKICMWAWLTFPISDITKRDPPSVDFPDIGIKIHLPIPFDRKYVVVRVIYVTFDPLSDSSKTWNQPSQPFEGSVVEVVDYWHQKKTEFEREIWNEQFRMLELERKQLGAETINEPSMKSLVHHKETNDPIKAPVDDTQIDEEKQTSSEIEQIEDDQIVPQKNSEIVEDDETVPNDAEEEYYSANTLLTTVQGSSELISLESIEDFNYDIKEDILDCIFAVQESPSQNVSLRKIIQEGKISYIVNNLQSLKVDQSYKDNILKYFKILPDFDSGIKEYLIGSKETKEIGNREINFLKKIKNLLRVETTPHELNLRKFTILGGIYYFDLIKHILQQFPLKDESCIQVQVGMYEIEKDDFVFIYEPPQIVETDEDEEEKPPPDDNIDKLIQVEISLPEHILWFEAPTPVLWHKDEKIWSKQHVYDIKFNEEKQVINFRVGRALPIGLCAVRYNNLPFQTWEMRPGAVGSNTVLFSLTASTVIMEFTIKGDKVALESLQNATGAALEPILGKFYSIYELVNIMKRTGLDIFPGNDAFLYVEGHSLKDYVVEDQAYMGMAMFSQYFQFSWSRWNMLAGWSTVVYQTRQTYLQKQLPNYSMVMSNLFLTTIVACSEVSPAFSEESIPNIGFNPDLYSLLKNICSKKVRKLIRNIDINLVSTVYNFIEKTKFFSYS